MGCAARWPAFLVDVARVGCARKTTPGEARTMRDCPKRSAVDCPKSQNSTVGDSPLRFAWDSPQLKRPLTKIRIVLKPHRPYCETNE